MSHGPLPLLLISLLAAPSVLPAVGCAPPMPQEVARNSNTDSLPIWVSARAMTRADGTVDWSLIRGHPLRGGSLFNLVEASTNQDCSDAPRVTILTPPGHREPASISELVLASKGIFEGRVVTIEAGSYSSTPGLLLGVAVDDWLHADAAEQLDCLYVFYPGGSFLLGRYRVCVNHIAVPDPPTVGDRLLVALTRASGPYDDLGLIFAPSHKGIFLERSDGALAFSSDWRGLEGLTRREELRELLLRNIPKRHD